MKRSKKIMVILCLAGFVVLGIAAIKPGHDDFKNLKVLPKDISVDSLMYLMSTYERALGVGCDHCHVMKDANGKEDYASDAVSAKDACRSMMNMTDSINRKFFPQRNVFRIVEKVTCYTCHRGKVHPDKK